MHLPSIKTVLNCPLIISTPISSTLELRAGGQNDVGELGIVFKATDVGKG